MQENSVAKGSKTNSGRIQGSSSQKENNEPVSPVVTNGKEMGSWICGGTEKEDRPPTSSMTKDGSRMKSSKKQKKKRSSSSNTIISEETERDPEIEKAKREWNDHYKNNRERKSNTKRILRNYVKNHIFPNCKFLTEDMVKFSRKKKSLSRKICSEFKIPERIWSFWWEDYVGFIKECMKERRASAVSNMKAEYYGE